MKLIRQSSIGTRIGIWMVVLAGMGCAECLAQQVVGTAEPSASTTSQSSTSHSSGLGNPVDENRLNELRGGESSTEVDVHNLGVVDGNTADGTISGGNAIEGGAFANAAGINTVIQNTGSNVLIQNGSAVNVQFADPMP